MALLWPAFLWLLLLLPLLLAVYIWRLRRRQRFALRYSSLGLVRAAVPRGARLRRHLPAALFLPALGCLVVALGRPVSIISVPSNQTVILLAIDVSRSMCSTDVDPSRIEAAQAAANGFIDSQPAGTQIGVVAFSGFAELIQAPTTDKAALRAAIDSLATGRRTAIGSGLLKALDAIAEVDHLVAPSMESGLAGPAVTPVPKGAFAPDIVVLLTDGVSNAGPRPLDAAQQAADRGVRVYTIGFGTAAGAGGRIPNCGQQFIGNEPGGGQFGGNGFGGGFLGGGGGQFGGGGFRRGIDEDTLKQMAALTDGKYYSAESADELQQVFSSLPLNLITKHETTEISVGFVAAGAVLATLALGLALLWQPLP